MCLQQDSPKRHVSARCNDVSATGVHQPALHPFRKKRRRVTSFCTQWYSIVIYPDLNVLSPGFFLGFLRISTFFSLASHNCTVCFRQMAPVLQRFTDVDGFFRIFLFQKEAETSRFKRPGGGCFPTVLMIVQLVQLPFMIRKNIEKRCVAVSTVCFFS